MARSAHSLDFCHQTRKSNYEQSILLCGRIFYSLVIKLLDKLKILQISRKHGGEYYVKRFDGWTHLVVMLYAVIMRFDSLREIMPSIQAESIFVISLLMQTGRSPQTLSFLQYPVQRCGTSS